MTLLPKMIIKPFLMCKSGNKVVSTLEIDFVPVNVLVETRHTVRARRRNLLAKGDE